jgi:hypothetical protein
MSHRALRARHTRPDRHPHVAAHHRANPLRNNSSLDTTSGPDGTVPASEIGSVGRGLPNRFGFREGLVADVDADV